MQTLVVKWSSAALEAIRHLGTNPSAVERNRIGPPMVARSLAILHTAIYDAWAVYDTVAKGVHYHGKEVLPAGPGAIAVKEQAVSQAAFKVLSDQFPTEVGVFKQLMADLGFPITSVSMSPATPDGVGNLVAKAVLDFRHSDGSNQLGDINGGPIYSDYTGYAPKNTPIVLTSPSKVGEIADPERWQPLSYNDASGVLRTPSFIAPHWEKVIPFALSSASEFRPTPPAKITSQAFLDQAKHVIEIQQNLTPKHKVIAEYWADGPKSELPPGHWALFAAFMSEKRNHTFDDDVKLFFALSNAIFDASIATWESKLFYDYARPVTAIRHLLRGKKIRGWNGTAMSEVMGEAWRTYQVPTFVTPPFPEYTSGHSGFSMAGAEVLRSFTGSDVFGGSYIQQVPLRVEPTMAVAVGIELKWETFTEAALEAGESRLYGGIHFYEGNVSGLKLGREVGAKAWTKAKAFWEGH